MTIYFDKIGQALQALYPPGARFGRRNIHDFEFVWINQGDVIWHCDGHDYECSPNTLILVRPGMEDSFTWDPVKQTVHSFVHFSVTPALWNTLPDNSDYSLWPKLLHLPESNIVYPLFEHLRFLQSQPVPTTELIQHCLLQILLSFIHDQCGRTDERLDDLHPAIIRVFDYLDSLWTEDMIPMPSIEDLTRAAGTSEVHLGRLFRETFGTSPAKAIRAIRMERAAKYLVGTNMRIQEISDILGCDSPYQFSRSFKSVYHRSPRDYRDYYRDHPMDVPLNANKPWSSNILDRLGTDSSSVPQPHN